ncbi:MAG: PilC/PilY family type IV pilus protein [Pseudomonadota bacterium]
MTNHVTPRQTRPSLTAGLIACAVTLLAGGAAADDTDIFVQAIPPADPNVLMILDTSGSMDSELVVSEDYDSNVDYGGVCDPNRIYYVRQDNFVEVPSCDEFDFNYTLNTSMFCEAAVQGLAAAGFFTDRFAQWDVNDEQWEKLAPAVFTEDPPGEERPIECQEDEGRHGDGADDVRLWPVAAFGSEGDDEDDEDDEDGGPDPWTADENNKLDWLAEDIYTLYSGNYINWLSDDRGERISTRIEILKDVGQDLIAGIGGINIGLMRFSSDAEGGMVVHPVSSINDPINRATLLGAIEALQPGGNTPLAETLYEAERYLSGSPVQFGLDSVGNGGAPQPSVPSSRDGNIYRSPLTEMCQANYIVLLTDGLPVSDTQADTAIEGLTGLECSGSCLNELSNWMATYDFSDSIDDLNNVLTYTIGFFTDDELLRDTATATRPDQDGDGVDDVGYYTANDVLELSEALREVFEDIEVENQSFQSPAVAVDGFNRLVNSDELYFTMFIPSAAPHWTGNIKKYRLAEVNLGVEGEDGEIEDALSMEIVDADGRLAIDADGLFAREARSLWSLEADGPNVDEGGLRNRMGVTRSIFTDTAFAGAEVDLWLPENRFEVANPLITASMLNVPEAERDATVRFLSGVDENGDPAPIFGDPLHSNPTLVSFSSGSGDVSQKMFVATNDGYLHAVNVRPATETEAIEDWSFIPSNLLGDLVDLVDNEPANPSYKGYGLDGPLSFWIKDDDGDNVVEPGETLFVYFAMRRGGRNYYALRIPGDNPDQPTLAWTLRGGSSSFAEMGQSWSAATVATMNKGGQATPVLVMGGGYDPLTQDTVGPPQPDNVGRAIYVVDAETGARLWWAGPSFASGGTPDLVLDGMINSIPSDVAVVDAGGDGLADRFYVGDMGGHVWRIDLDDLAVPLSNRGYLLADLGDDADAGNRRFYYAPSISRVLDDVFGSFLTISLGTGHRASPLSLAVEDRFYMLRDVNVFAAPADVDGNAVVPDPILESALLDITENVSPEVDQLNAAKGWLLRLGVAGEKNLAEALTADGKVFFSSYLPDGGFVPECNLAGVLGSGRLYTMDLVSGAPVLLDDPLSEDGATPEDRFQDLDVGGIPPAPTLIFTECDGPCLSEDPPGDEDGDGEDDEENANVGGTGCENPFSQVTLLIGTETGDPGICNAPVRTFWRQNK